VLFGWLVHRTRSLATAMLAHAMANGVPLLVQVVGFSVSGYSAGLEGAPVLQPLWFDLTGLAFASLGLAGLIRSLPRSVTAGQSRTA
jgi:hypothetical protein